MSLSYLTFYRVASSVTRTYSQGVYNDPSCSSVYVNHAMLLVGYGTTADGLKYWILKNRRVLVTITEDIQSNTSLFTSSL